MGIYRQNMGDKLMSDFYSLEANRSDAINLLWVVLTEIELKNFRCRRDTFCTNIVGISSDTILYFEGKRLGHINLVNTQRNSVNMSIKHLENLNSLYLEYTKLKSIRKDIRDYFYLALEMCNAVSDLEYIICPKVYKGILPFYNIKDSNIIIPVADIEMSESNINKFKDTTINIKNRLLTYLFEKTFIS